MEDLVLSCCFFSFYRISEVKTIHFIVFRKLFYAFYRIFQIIFVTLRLKIMRKYAKLSEA